MGCHEYSTTKKLKENSPADDELAGGGVRRRHGDAECDEFLDLKENSPTDDEVAERGVRGLGTTKAWSCEEGPYGLVTSVVACQIGRSPRLRRGRDMHAFGRGADDLKASTRRRAISVDRRPRMPSTPAETIVDGMKKIWM